MADGGMAVNTGPAVSGRAGNSAAASLGKSFTPAVAVLAGASSVFLAGSGGSVKQGEDASADDNNRPTTGSGTAAAGQVPNTAPTANREAPVLSSKTQGVRSKPPVIGSQDPAASNLLPSSLGKRATPASGEVPLEAGNAPPSVMGGKALEEGHQQTAASGDAQAPAAGGGQAPLPRPQSAAVGSCTLVPGGQKATAAAAGGLAVTATGGSTALLGEMGQTLAGGGQQQQQQDAAGGGNALVAGSHSPVEADQAQAARLPPHGAPMLTGQLLEEKQVLQAVMLLRQHRHQQHRQLLQHPHPHHHQKQQGQHQQQR
ncbi:hypothetical protein PLESTF_001804500 [Pleodorina starrii]|nr:hypothetical protein PLESTF_001804500 [Pleodorina starrii]